MSGGTYHFVNYLSTADIGGTAAHYVSKRKFSFSRVESTPASAFKLSPPGALFCFEVTREENSWITPRVHVEQWRTTQDSVQQQVYGFGQTQENKLNTAVPGTWSAPRLPYFVPVRGTSTWHRVPGMKSSFSIRFNHYFLKAGPRSRLHTESQSHINQDPQLTQNSYIPLFLHTIGGPDYYVIVVNRLGQAKSTALRKQPQLIATASKSPSFFPIPLIIFALPFSLPPSRNC